MNNKGFTLVELLATVALLGILMLIAVPNVVGVVNKNKSKTYVEDAKKLVSLAEYKVRADPENYKPTSSTGPKCFKMSFLSADDFSSAPNGGCYDDQQSYVVVSWGSNKVNYKVQLLERKTCDKSGNNYTGAVKAGIVEIPSGNLFDSDATKNVVTSGFKSIPCSQSNTY